MILMIDNYDSFTFNLVQYLGELGAEVKVFRNDAISVDDIKKLAPEKIVISPGPCTPDEAGISVETILAFAEQVPILGVCLGHEAIGAAFGGKIIKAKELMHGKTSIITHDGKGIFNNIANPFEATRYHSLSVDSTSLPQCLEVSARTDDGEIMGFRHKEYNISGIQFHPESILTTVGKDLLKNFLLIN
ncbi:MAG: aminodeoxychorismate/anthranilate synthase component II [Deltaproteobacteria bacterium]|nr:aminodeoxychorismate/anthranilate synthase component II [Deltaproteobacteria bacterium]